MSQPPVTRVELDTPITGEIKLPKSTLKRNVLSYPFVNNSPTPHKGKSSSLNRKRLIYGVAFLCIAGLAALVYTQQDRIKSLFGAKGGQGTKKTKNDRQATKESESSDEEEGKSDILDIDEDILPIAKSQKKNKKQKKIASTNDIYFTPI
jgi:hypothetical protein